MLGIINGIWFLLMNQGNHIQPQTVLKRFKNLALEIDKPSTRFHGLRHTYAVTLIQEEDDIKTVQENLGHATAAFTLDVYGHVSEKMKKESTARMEKFIQNIKGQKPIRGKIGGKIK